MAQRKNYNQLHHKILHNWNDILKLIAIEEEILERLNNLEAMSETINKNLTKIEKEDKSNV